MTCFSERWMENWGDSFKKGGEIKISNIKYQKSKIFLIGFLLLAVFLGVLLSPALAKGKLEFKVKEGTPAPEAIDYVLPYPGILPDNPLYFLKMLRDKIWGFLIRNPLKNSQWSLLMADKRIWASEMLAEKGKFDLSVTTLTKAEKYLEKAVDNVYLAKEMGEVDRGYLKKMVGSSRKHEEMLGIISKKVPENLKPVVQEASKYPENAREKILKLLTE